VALAAALALLGSGACRNPPESAGSAHPFGRAPAEAGPAPLVSGTALDARSGKPLADVLIRGPGGVETRSDARGRFVLRGLVLGSEGEILGSTASGLSGRNLLRPLDGSLEIVIYLR